LLKENADFLKMKVISYCLMSNHFHLLFARKMRT
jgi:REP element-mobilizing transposase RayT